MNAEESKEDDQGLKQVMKAKAGLKRKLLTGPEQLDTGDHYAAVKKICCLEKPVPSPVMTATVLSKPKGLMSVATKVLIQMNCKLGGKPWAVNIPLKNTMVLGYDTYHDSLHKDKSVGALVASINKTFTQFISSAEVYSNQSDLTDRMTPGIVKAIRRDGVGDGQIQNVLEHEVAAIKACFKQNRM